MTYPNVKRERVFCSSPPLWMKGNLSCNEIKCCLFCNHLSNCYKVCQLLREIKYKGWETCQFRCSKKEFVFSKVFRFGQYKPEEETGCKG